MSSADLIGVHVRTPDADAVRQAVTATFTAAGFAPGAADDGSYDVVVTEAADGWVSVLVADWPDSGVLARGLSARLAQPVLELWVSDNIHWGYTLCEHGAVVDRFADDPVLLAEDAAETALYAGRAEALTPLLRVPVARAAAALEQAHHGAGQFAAGAIDALAECLGLPFEQAFLGIEEFWDEDADDLPPFRLLSFRPPPGRESLADVAAPQ